MDDQNKTFSGIDELVDQLVKESSSSKFGGYVPTVPSAPKSPLQSMRAETTIPSAKIVPTPTPAQAPIPVPRPERPLIPSEPAVPQFVPQVATGGGGREFQSVIRTMGMDIDTLKKGQRNVVGTEVSKKFDIPGIPGQISPTSTIKPISPPPPPPKPLTFINESSNIKESIKEVAEFKEPKESRPLPAKTGFSKTRFLFFSSSPDEESSRISPEKENLDDSKNPPVPSKSGSPDSRALNIPIGKILIFLILMVSIGGGVYWYFFYRKPIVEIVVTPTPIPTQQVAYLSELFINDQNFNIPQGSLNPTEDFNNFLSGLNIGNGEFVRLNIFGKTGKLGVAGIFNEFVINYPVQINDILNKDDSIILAYGQSEIFSPDGQISQPARAPARLALIIETTDAIKLNDLLGTWEKTMTQDLAPLFGYDPTKGGELMTNESQQGKIRYKNFPYPDRTLDYAIISSKNGKSYLIMAGSRGATLHAIARLR
jgi:hypothetical protein